MPTRRINNRLWAIFAGSATFLNDRWTLRPNLDPGIEIFAGREDALIDGRDVCLLVGARVKIAEVPSSSVLRTGSAPTKAPNIRCPGGDTTCIGEVEFCCDTSSGGQEVLGECIGFWPCP